MKIARFISKIIFFVLLSIDISIFGSLIYLNQNLSQDFKINKGDTLNINTPLPVTAVYQGEPFSKNHTRSNQTSFDVDLKMFGVIPFSTVNVEIIDELQVAVLGTPFGMKIYTKGVLVIDITDIETESGKENPAKEMGIKKGDYILSVNGKSVSTNEDLADIVENSGGEMLNLKISRNKKLLTVRLNAVKSRDDGKYKIGVWIRDSSAGIGTLTFYSPSLNIACGLGHGICDEDTGKILNVDSGEGVSAQILSVVKGKSGEPGQLKGSFTGESFGKIRLNCAGGVYMTPTGEFSLSYLTEIGLKNTIKNGNAKILCTIKGDTPKLYSCKIALKSGNFNKNTQNMIVTVTDKALLETTGGIVQGLSGSPIIQNGRLVGAVTHVLVDDPTKGYGIFAENMLETAQSVAKQNLQNAS